QEHPHGGEAMSAASLASARASSAGELTARNTLAAAGTPAAGANNAIGTRHSEVARANKALQGSYGESRCQTIAPSSESTRTPPRRTSSWRSVPAIAARECATRGPGSPDLPHWSATSYATRRLAAGRSEERRV